MAKFIKGLNAYKPSANAPSFIISNISISKKELIQALNEEQGDTIKLDLKLSQDGTKHYFQVNEYKKA